MCSMSLDIKPLVQSSALEFSATPYIGTDLWEEGINCFHNWVFNHFTIGTIYGDYQLAEKMDVHRAISDVWLTVLVHRSVVCSHTITLGKSVDAPQVHAFEVMVAPVKRRKKLIINFGELTKFDPWEDRSLDEDLPDAMA